MNRLRSSIRPFCPVHKRGWGFILVFFLAYFLFFHGRSESREFFFYAKVKTVIDGDTIILKNGARVRYLNINTPEIFHDGRKNEPFAIEAKRLNIRLVSGKYVRLSFDKVKRDSHGRLLAHVFLNNGTWVNAELIKAGLAYLLYDVKNHASYKKLLKFQRDAINKGEGIWGTLKKEGELNRERLYLGNGWSHKFHKLLCPFGKHTRNKIYLRSLKEAFYRGYAPCRRCHPLMSVLSKGYP